MKRILISSIVLFVFAILWNGLVHLVLLKDFMVILQPLRRPNPTDLMWLSLILTFGITFLFSLGHRYFNKAGSYSSGVLYGLYFGLLAGLLVDLNQYINYPIPAYIVAAWFAFGVMEFVIYGLLSTKILFSTRARV